MSEPVPESLLTQVRKKRGLSLDEVAAKVGTSEATLSRIERGVQVPRRDLARAIYEYFDGKVALGAIYDPEYCRQVAR